MRNIDFIDPLVVFTARDLLTIYQSKTYKVKPLSLRHSKLWEDNITEWDMESFWSTPLHQMNLRELNLVFIFSVMNLNMISLFKDGYPHPKLKIYFEIINILNAFKNELDLPESQEKDLELMEFVTLGKIRSEIFYGQIDKVLMNYKFPKESTFWGIKFSKYTPAETLDYVPYQSGIINFSSKGAFYRRPYLNDSKYPSYLEINPKELHIMDLINVIRAQNKSSKFTSQSYLRKFLQYYVETDPLSWLYTPLNELNKSKINILKLYILDYCSRKGYYQLLQLIGKISSWKLGYEDYLDLTLLDPNLSHCDELGSTVSIKQKLIKNNYEDFEQGINRSF